MGCGISGDLASCNATGPPQPATIHTGGNPVAPLFGRAVPASHQGPRRLTETERPPRRRWASAIGGGAGEQTPILTTILPSPASCPLRHAQRAKARSPRNCQADGGAQDVQGDPLLTCSPAAGSRMCSRPISAARLNKATRCPASGLLPAFHRHTHRTLTRNLRASPRDVSPAAFLKRSNRCGKSSGNREGSTW